MPSGWIVAIRQSTRNLGMRIYRIPKRDQLLVTGLHMELNSKLHAFPTEKKNTARTRWVSRRGLF